ncbi:DUF3429 domain-containing protein [Thiomicrorhabdus aquaedulcis]|uniref:DUF3429 domain-containing protein n=1 Tax=Thiomicrorhabdus aquaedulcis TaxID=2211106 RepID=UPI001562BDB8|nr:DUF3429 domain-containing protein [Thiomicrorhabdus aquaedulcis]
MINKTLFDPDPALSRQPQIVASVLTYLGTLPFLYGVLWALNVVATPPLPFSIEAALMGYTVVIISFIAGIHWGLAVSFYSHRSTQQWHSNARPLDDDTEFCSLTRQQNSKHFSESNFSIMALFISSNVMALWAWLMLLLWFVSTQQAWSSWLSWLGLAMAFAVLLTVDYVWARVNDTHSWLWLLRWQASSVAIVSMFAMAFKTA